ncbi:hypothetical protein DK926_04930 [Rhodococcus sp. Eu-32]|uniref:hypothetical protein n=1 Tax=Rhodococcus sp. Eu-32 TaxID=1017319 RepID=UPI000DF3DF54|nr:hypothetical protein [Rhodococcus sp. Eu-32]RRQ29228.1 hypothetical protein DK926_04930 [Rhodococcus sp. Eu-32]
MLSAEELTHRIRERGLPEPVVALAILGGAAVHPALEYEVDSIHLDGDGPSFSVIEQSGRGDLVPLWTLSATVTVFSASDGTFLEWSAEDEEPWTIWPDFAAVVRHLLTNLYEASASEQHRQEIAALLLPERQAVGSLMPEQR